jgi:hypothetical protein
MMKMRDRDFNVGIMLHAAMRKLSSYISSYTVRIENEERKSKKYKTRAAG